MPFGYGRGRGRGFGPGTAWGGGPGFGFGFRGASPPWPYVGLGRGGLPRHAWGMNAAAYPPPAYNYPAYGSAPWPPAAGDETELDYLKKQAELIRDQLKKIDSRMNELEKD